MVSIYRINILERQLQELAESTNGVRGAVVVSLEGFVVAAYTPGDAEGSYVTDLPQVAAMAATLFALGEQALLRLVQGSIERLLLEGEAGAMLVHPIIRQAVLVTMIDKEAKMGLTMMAALRTARALAEVLGED